MYRMQRRRPASVHLLILSVGLGLVASVAVADDKKSIVNGDTVDISKISNHMVFAHDGSGHYIAATPGTNTYELFFGDGKTFYKQIVRGGGSDGSKDSNNWTYYEPRESGHGSLDRKKSVWTVSCGKRKITFNTLSEAERKKLLKTAKWKPFRFRHQPHALLRDRRGTYYFIDKLRENGKGYRLFVGRRGNMKKFKLEDIVDDSEGQIFVTKKGDLHLVLDDDEKITWSKDEKNAKKLKKLPVWKNRLLIYTDLGPYENERVGTPCDDL